MASYAMEMTNGAEKCFNPQHIIRAIDWSLVVVQHDQRGILTASYGNFVKSIDWGVIPGVKALHRVYYKQMETFNALRTINIHFAIIIWTESSRRFARNFGNFDLRVDA
jgi:hypothetical protein